MLEHPERAIERTKALLALWLPLKLHYNHIPGISLAIRIKDELVYKSAFGLSDKSKKSALTTNNLFQFASHSKLVTSAAIFRLYDQNKLRLDDRIVDYLPWFSQESTSSDRIMIRQLLSHTSGLCRDSQEGVWDSLEFPTFGQLRELIKPEWFTYEPLETFKYSNLGYAILGDLISEVYGKHYHQAVKELVFDPLDMASSTMECDDNVLARAAIGYEEPLPFADQARTYEFVKTNAFAPAAGLMSTPEDLTKLCKMFHEKNGFLSEEARRLMMKIEVNGIEFMDGYGLGPGREECDGSIMYGHGGSFDGFSTETIYDKASEVTVSVGINQTNESAYDFCRAILEALKEFDSENGVKKELLKYAGTYRSKWGDLIMFPVKDTLYELMPTRHNPISRKVTHEISNLAKHEFIQKKDNLFVYPGEVFSFRVDESGQGSELDYFGVKFKRLDYPES